MTFESIKVGVLRRLRNTSNGGLKERAFCVVFEDEIERCWSRRNLGDTEGREQIQAFAKSHGWSVSIHDFESGRIGEIFLPF